MRYNKYQYQYEDDVEVISQTEDKKREDKKMEKERFTKKIEPKPDKEKS